MYKHVVANSGYRDEKNKKKKINKQNICISQIFQNLVRSACVQRVSSRILQIRIDNNAYFADSEKQNVPLYTLHQGFSSLSLGITTKCI